MDKIRVVPQGSCGPQRGSIQGYFMDWLRYLGRVTEGQDVVVNNGS